MTSHGARRAAAAIIRTLPRHVKADPKARGSDWRTATVASVNAAAGTITTTDGIICRCMETYLAPAASDQIVISQSGSGNWLAAGRLAPGHETDWATYTPTVANAGSVTWTTRTGFWKRASGIVYVNVYLVVLAAGTGTGVVSITMPTNVARTNRQILTMHTESVGAGGNAVSHIGGGECLFLPAGSGAVSDRLRTDEGSTTARENNIQGADLLAASSITVQGWYREP